MIGNPIKTLGVALTLTWLAGAAPPPAEPGPPAGMVQVPAGIYRPPFPTAAGSNGVPVKAFHLDVIPVTNAEFLKFVRAHPRWRRSQASRLVAEETYLRHWAGDLELGPLAPSNAPVTAVSYSAALGFARWKDKRLPTTAEWELAAAGTTRGEGEAQFQRRILDWYSRATPAVPAQVGATPANDLGLRDLHGLIWEWVSDFNTIRPDEGRGDAGPGSRTFCGGGAAGATNRTDYATFMRFGFRSSLRPEYAVHNLGFRCARDLPAQTR